MPNGLIQDHLTQALVDNGSLQAASKIVVGYSAGLDSTALLFAIAQVFPFKPKIALHVHHGLQSEADAWVNHARAEVNRINQHLALSGVYAIHFEAHYVAVEVANQGIEAAARAARYAVFERSVDTANTVLVLAHHANDQIETFWLRVLRGTGIKGLQGMPHARPLGHGLLVRPWLRYSRKQLEDYAQVHALRWVEDPSNQVLDFDRNWLRQQVLTGIYPRKPSLHHRFNALFAQLNQTQSILDEVLANDWQQCVSTVDASVDLALLAMLSYARQQQVLTAWLERHLSRTPEHQWVERLQQDVILAKPDRQPLLRLGEHEIRRFQGRLYALPRLATLLQQSQIPETGYWCVADCIKLESGFHAQLRWPLGQLDLRVVKGRGLSLDSWRSLRWVLKPNGVRILLPNQQRPVLLKHWLHSEAIMPWLRPWAPCLMKEGQLLDIAGCLAEKQPRIGDNDLGLVWEWHLPAPYALRPSAHNKLNVLETNR